MTTKKKTQRGPKGKADAQRAADELTAERVRAILSDPTTPGSVAGKLQSLINRLGGATDAPMLDSPDFYAHAFAGGAELLHRGQVAPLEADEAREAAEQITRLAERHEPKAYKVARRCREIYADWLGRKGGRKYADGAHFFMEHIDAVLEGGEDGLLPNADSKYFVPLFVEAFEAHGPQSRAVRRLLALIKRVDEGADLNELRDESERRWEEGAEKRKPKDTRLVEALSEVLADPRRGEDREAVLDNINSLSNYTVGVSDLHPEIFPTLARVVICEARKQARGRSRDARSLRRYLGELEAIAAGE